MPSTLSFSLSLYIVSELIACGQALGSGPGVVLPQCTADVGANGCAVSGDETSFLAISQAVVRSKMRADDVAPDDNLKPWDCKQLGPLQGLLGEWESTSALTLGSVPWVVSWVNSPDDTLLVSGVTFTDTLKFEPIPSPTPNRVFYTNMSNVDHGQVNSYAKSIQGIRYTERSVDFKGEEIHDEAGHWTLNENPSVGDNWQLLRTFSLPRGLVVMAPGHHSMVSASDVARERVDLNNLVQLGPGGVELKLDGTPLALQGEEAWNRTELIRSLRLGDILRRAGDDIISANSSATRFQFSSIEPPGSVQNMMEYVKTTNFSSVAWLFETESQPVLQVFQRAVVQYPDVDETMQFHFHMQVVTYKKASSDWVCS